MHGIIKKQFPNPEETDRIMRSAIESGADENKLKALAFQGMRELFKAPEIQFAWQRTWPEYSNIPELILASKVGYAEKVLQLLRLGANPAIQSAGSPDT